MPECTLGILAVGGEHGVGGGGSRLVGLDERREDLLEGSVVVVVGVRADARAIDRLGPAVAHVVTLASVVPGLQLDEVGLEVQDLAEAVLEVLLATAVPVTELRVMLELERRDAHDKGFAGSMSTVEIGHIVGGGDDNITLGVLRPGVPVHCAVEGGELGGEEVRGSGNILECWYKVDWMPCVSHDLLEFDLPSVVYVVLTKGVLRCTALCFISRSHEE